MPNELTATFATRRDVTADAITVTADGAGNSAGDGQHHFVPAHWIDHVDTHVHLNKSLADIRATTTNPGVSEAVPSPS